MNLTIVVNDLTMTVEGEAFELALFARSVGKAAVGGGRSAGD